MELLAHISFVGLVVLLYLRQVHTIREECDAKIKKRNMEHVAIMARVRLEHLRAVAPLALQHVRALQAAKVWKQAAKKWWTRANG